ncbi:MAG: UDP-N-acetylmuramate--L-alanine ligase [Candidatus Omnitrophica bacterium]|nr:UDP-N-acetylmuramate--L-alanine ligase [Candidatus Omnitrophota bacterium]
MLRSKRNIHFVGIGGIGMSGIAWLCLKRGHTISGSDIKSSSIVDKLVKEGAKVHIGHRWENIKKIDIVVYSSAILSNNPELSEAKRLNIPMLKRGEFLAFLAEGKKCIAVTGAHGKTTTSSIISTMLKEANLTPSGVVGALVPYLDGNAFIGDGEYFVTEADESDGSFLYLKPDYSVITNIDLEHLDYYENIEDIKNAYLKFMNNTKPDGAVICWGQDPYIKKISKYFKGRLLTYGTSRKNDLCASKLKTENLESEFNCIYKNRDLGKFKIRIPGEHNIHNALGAILVGLVIGLEPAAIRSAIYQYMGAERRFQVKASINEVTVVDDYAHHPTEIKATLKVACNMPHKRLIVVFQPHRFSRTKLLKKEFAQAFDNAGYLILTDIYAANEKPIYGVTSMNIYDDVLKTKKINVNYIAKPRLLDYLKNFIKRGDLLLFLGAGDIGRLSGEFIHMLKDKKENDVTR